MNIIYMYTMMYVGYCFNNIKSLDSVKFMSQQSSTYPGRSQAAVANTNYIIIL